MHYTCKYYKNMKYRMYITLFSAYSKKHRTDCIHNASAQQPHKAPKGQCFINRHNGKYDTPPHTYIANHWKYIIFFKVNSRKRNCKRGDTPNKTKNCPAITGFVFRTSDSIIGVYVPAIIKYIVQWSSTWSTFLAIPGFTPWYTLDIVKSEITDAPYIADDTTPHTLPCKAEKITHSTRYTTPNPPPTMWVTILKISSPFV